VSSEKKNPDNEPQKSDSATERSRRDFLNEVAAGALGIAGLGSMVVTVKYLSPNVLFEPPTSFRVGAPDDYPVNSVTYFADQQVYLIRTVNGFFAMSAVCTHLGCITQWHPEANLIECPCHGSRYQRNGTVVHGPAPRALPHFSVRLMQDGTLMVDKLEIVKQSQVLKV
jgi:cytochrome b6-f complex iron-sulfur subunit